jgi:hypothetical protein
MKEDEVRSIIIEWSESYRPPQHQSHGKRNATPGEPTFSSDAPDHIRYAMRHNFNWQKLSDLVNDK